MDAASTSTTDPSFSIACYPIEFVDLLDKCVIIKPHALLKEELSTTNAKFKVKRAVDGFGCNPGATRSTVYLRSPFPNLPGAFNFLTYCSRSDILGWVTEEDAEKISVWETLTTQQAVWDILQKDIYECDRSDEPL